MSLEQTIVLVFDVVCVLYTLGIRALYIIQISRFQVFNLLYNDLYICFDMSYVSIRPSSHPTINPPDIYPPPYLSIYLYVCLYILISVYLPVYLSISLTFCLSIHPVTVVHYRPMHFKAFRIMSISNW